MKKAMNIVSIPLIIIIIIILYISYLTNNNQNYLDSITKDIENNYPLEEEITYSNFYNNYYIFTTENKVIVLNNEFEEILNESITTILDKEENQELIYKTNKLMFEEKTQNKNKLIYTYYDATNGEVIKETIMEKK